MTTHYYTLYALRAETVDSATNILEKRLSLTMDKVDSGAWGYYTAYESSETEEMVYVYQNLQNDDGPYLREKEYPDHSILISVYDTERSDVIGKAVMDQFDATVVRDIPDPPPPPKPFY